MSLIHLGRIPRGNRSVALRNHVGQAISIRGVRKIVGFGGTPYPLEEHEMNAIQELIDSEVNGHTFRAVPHLRFPSKAKLAVTTLAIASD